MKYDFFSVPFDILSRKTIAMVFSIVLTVAISFVASEPNFKVNLVTLSTYVT